MPGSNSLLETKIQVPPLAAAIVPRQRLYERLDAALQPINRLTLISAPAGYGKTSLANAWLRDRRIPAAWLTIDERDNDPVRFGDYLVAALSSLEPELAEPDRRAGPFAHGEFQEKTLIPVLNSLTESPRASVIVLDDFHCIHDPDVEQLVDFVLDNLPPSLHIFILSRADPALMIAKLRGRGQLIDLRMEDLRFNKREVEQLVALFDDIELPADAIETLAQNTEGWIAGLQMAITSLQGERDKAKFIEQFSGRQEYIMDYLLDEVLRRQSPRVQSFLLNTSILDRMCGSLCDTVLQDLEAGQSTGTATLRELMRANLFLIPLDEPRTWFRYHRLFADLLQARLQREHPDRLAKLHRRASAWFEQHGESELAMQHALANGDFEKAAQLLERVAQDWLMRSETATFLRWIQQIPAEFIRAHPRLVIYQAWALLFQGAPLRVVNALMSAESEQDSFPGGSALLRSFVSLSQGEVEHGLELAEQALDDLEPNEIFLRDFAKFCIAGARIALGDEESARELFQETTETSLESGNRSAAVIFLSELGEMRMKEMHLDEASRFYDQAREAATDSSGNLLPIGGRTLIGLGTIALERYRLDQAEALLLEGIALTARWNLFGTLEGHLALATIYELRGDTIRLADKLAEVQELAEQFDATEIDDLVVELVEAGIRARQRDLTWVRDWLSRRGLENAPSSLPEEYSADRLLGRIYKYELPVIVRYLIATERFEDAEMAVGDLLQRAREANRAFLMIEAWILEAVLMHAQGKLKPCHEAMKSALALAAPAGTLRLFISESESLAPILAEVHPTLEEPELLEFTDQILMLGKHQPAYGLGAVQTQLSERELDILRLLPTDLTAEQIAEELVISVNTVRTHMKNIYAKLDVHSRHMAVDKARKADLI